MAEISTAEARDRFPDVINRAAYGKERVILTRRGKEVVAVVPIEDVRLHEEFEDRLDLGEARAALAGVEREGTIPWNRLKIDFGL